MTEAVAPFRRVGPYLVLQLSGAGGMGRVDVVLSPRPGGFTKVCVLKRMLPELRTPEQEARFRREASIALRMSHGAIAQTLDVVEVDGELCLLQEFIQGTTLAHVEQRAAAAGERLPVPLVLHVGAEIARALAYAHSFDGGGVIHRDVAPDNIMLSFGGEAKLVDFGIAKSVSEQPLTEVGKVVGRPIYTAPEVLARREADSRSDVYSLGVVLWQALSGDNFPDLLDQGGAAPSPPSRTNPSITPEVDAVVLKAVSVRAADRYQSADAMQEALAAQLPRGYVPSKELSAFLARHFNVERERRQLAEDVERGRRMLAEDAAARDEVDSGPIASIAAPKARRDVAAWIGTGLVLSVAIVLGASRVFSHTTVVQPTSANSSAAAVSQPARAVALPVSPAKEKVAEASPPDQPAKARRARRSTERPVPPRNGAALLRDADRSFKSGDLPGALALARQALREGAGGEAHLLMGRIFYARNELPEAEAEFEKARPAPDAARYLEMLRDERGRAAR